MQRRVGFIDISRRAARPGKSAPILAVAVAGLVLAAVLLMVFHSMVSAAVRRAEATQMHYRLSAHPEPLCRGAGIGAGPDLCMLHAAVPAKLIHAARAPLRKPSSALQARAD